MGVSYRSAASLALSEEKFERIQSLLVIKEWQLSISQNMSKFQVVIQLLLVLQTFGSPVELLSQLPEDPIDPPNDWAWGLHPMVLVIRRQMIFFTRRVWPPQTHRCAMALPPLLSALREALLHDHYDHCDHRNQHHNHKRTITINNVI